ncbi:hypothetical protein [Sphingobium sp. WCS2017Hpa-17]|uniref:hypothetical protein n=1 Tax=Sphingobium sp. WCS2017Hpa-17 TaxID=3073638 RepID=UPI00288A9007|nr:hypothetical protein [Sphingobium sp. WCS2017Hpa-17]
MNNVASGDQYHMPFEPFGYRFEINSPMSPSEVKIAIKSRKKGWLDAKNGARGWVVGPLICLWFSAFDQNGPMLFGVISKDAAGTRVRGRAGSDLNGVAMFSLLIPFMIFLIYKLILEGAASFPQLLVIAVFFLLGGPLIYWLAHKDRREAEPLTRFLRDTLTVSGKTLRRKSAAAAISSELVMFIGGERFSGIVTPNAIHDALIAVGTGSFVILEAGPETYIQTASRDGAYIVEKRDGGSFEHFRALRRKDNLRLAERQKDLFDFEEVREVFMAYASEAPVPPIITWEKIHLGE